MDSLVIIAASVAVFLLGWLGHALWSRLLMAGEQKAADDAKTLVKSAENELKKL